jgi:hypothetical protein
VSLVGSYRRRWWRRLKLGFGVVGGRWPSQTLKEVGPSGGRRHSGVARRWGRRWSRGWPAGGVRGGGVPESEPEAEEAWPRERATDCVVTWQQF